MFTGGSLLFGTTGRPDLLGDEHAEELARLQHGSARRLAQDLPGDTSVMPTHGFGSFCSFRSAGDSTDASTIAREQEQNPALTQDEQRWVAETLAGLDVYPAYYAQMAPANAAGPDAPDLSAPAVADREAVAERIASGGWVVDLRTRTAFAAGHASGTLNFGLDGQFSTYVGWLIPWDEPLTLLGESPEQVSEAQREPVRIGVDRLHGAATGEPSDWTAAPLKTFGWATSPTSRRYVTHRPVTVLDVRQASGYEAEHVVDTLNVALHELPGPATKVPDGEV